MEWSTPGLTVHHQFQSLPKLMFTESVMPSNHLILCHPLLLLPSIFPNIRIFSNESVLCIRWLKCWSFSFNISPSNEYPGLISFRMDWLDFLAVQGTFKSLLQHHSSKASILRHSAFFMEANILPLKKKKVYESNTASDGCELSCHMIIDLVPSYIPSSPQMWQCKPLPSWPSFFLLNQQLRVNSCLSQLLATLGKCQNPGPAQEHPPPTTHPGSTAVKT